MKTYSVSTRHYFVFGALVSEELSYKLKGDLVTDMCLPFPSGLGVQSICHYLFFLSELTKVRWVLPDSFLDVKNKDYGGEPFINGQAVPYDDPMYHEEWVRNNARANERNGRNDRPRNFNRSRNFERRANMQQNRMGNQGMQNPGPNMGAAPPSNMGGTPNMGGVLPSNMRGTPNIGRMPPSNMGGGMPHNNIGGPPPNMVGMQHGNMGGPLPNYMGGPSPNMGGMPSQSNGRSASK